MRTFPLQDGRLVLKILAAAGICVLLAITLWPFNPWPRNEVIWLHDEDGLRLCGHGTILSVAQFPNEAGAENEPFSLEFWMVPWRNEGSTVMFAFYVRQNPGQFVVRQDGLDVSVSHTTRQREEKNHHPLVAEQVIAQNKDPGHGNGWSERDDSICKWPGPEHLAILWIKPEESYR